MFKSYAVTFGGGTLACIGALTSILILLKINHVITWPWLLIISPLWIPMGLATLFVSGFLFFLLVISICVFLFGRKDTDTITE